MSASAPLSPAARPLAERDTSSLLRSAAALIDPFHWGEALARELRVRALKLENAAGAAALYCGVTRNGVMHRMGCSCDLLRALGEEVRP